MVFTFNLLRLDTIVNYNVRAYRKQQKSIKYFPEYLYQKLFLLDFAE